MIAKLFYEQRALIIAGFTALLGFFILAGLMFFDPTEILGINRWIKPMKFFMSFVIFLWTVALFLSFVKGRESFTRVISWGIIVIYVIEMSIIVLQAARGTTSHFNVKALPDAILYAVMGISIGISTLFIGGILYLYFRERIEFPKAIIWGIRLGIIVFLLGSFEGGYMSAQFGHSVGISDGGPGLPLVNWSTIGGDLRAAHFLGLHALQAVPLFAYLIDRIKKSLAVTFTFAFAAAYVAVFFSPLHSGVDGPPIGCGFLGILRS